MHQTALSSYVQQAIRGAGGGGGDSPRQPIESPDSLRSIAYARIQDLISEGEIYGFANQAKPLTCMFLNETPVANDDGSLNFKNVQIDSRVGTQTQDYMKGFDGVRNETAVGVELRYDTAWTRTFTNMNLDAINVRISTPMFQKTNTTNGDIGGTSVYYLIQLSVDGGPFNTIMTSGFVGKATTEYERGHRIDLPPATTNWTVRVRRLTPDSVSSAIANTTFVKAFTEIIDVKLRMPMSAYVGTIVDAEQFQQIPSRAFHMKGRIIRVPSNYDPDTRTYTGLWDGSFQSRYSNNPAWVFYDMALNKRYGLGHLVGNQPPDKWALYRIAQYCDQLVSDGFGGQEPRFTCNVYLQAQNDALQVMQDLATVFRGIMYAAGGSIVPVCDMPEDATYTYTNANVDDGEFNYNGSAKKVRHTVALVSWNDMTDFCRAKVEYVPDEEGIARYGVQETQVIAVGCTSRGQAHRFGRYLLATERAETDAVAFGVGLDGLRCAPGKIINVADKLRAGKRIGGRVVSSTANGVVLDSAPDIDAGDKLITTGTDGVTQESVILGVVGASITVLDPFPLQPVAQSVWAVETATVPVVKYRVLGVTEKGEGKEGYTVHGLKHAAWKFAFADTGIKLDAPPLPQVPGSVVPSPQNLEVTTRNVVEQNLVTKVASLSWDAVLIASNYNVQWRSNEGSWVDAGNNSATTREIYGIPAGPFEIQVVAIDSLGRRSLPTFGGPYDVVTPDQPPGVIDDVRGEITQEIIDRINGDFDVAAAAAIDATNKANAARDAAIAYADVIAAQLNDIIEADVWAVGANYVVGDIVQWDGKLYRSETDNIGQQPDTNPDDWLLMGNYTSLGEAVAASITLSTQAIDDVEALSTSLDAVIARMPAGVGALATQASVTDEATARASADTALGNRITVVEARMPAGSGQLATALTVSNLSARVDSVEGVNTAQGEAITVIQARMPAGVGALATAEAVTLLTARVTAAEGSLTTQASSITTLLTQVGGGSNLLTNSAFETASLYAWNPDSGSAGTPEFEVNNGEWPGDGSIYLPPNTRGTRYRYTGNPANATYSQMYSDPIACTPNAKYIASAWYNIFRCTVEQLIVFYDAVGTQVGEVATTQAATAVVNPRFDQLPRVVTAATAPATAVTVRMFIRFRSIGVAQPVFWVTRPMLEQVPAAKTVPSAWIAGASGLDLRYAGITQALDVRLTDTEGVATAAASAVTAVRASLGGNGNLMRNTEFEVDIAGYTASATNDGVGWPNAPVRDAAGDDWRPVSGHSVGLVGSGTVTSASFRDIYPDDIAVVPGKRYSFSAYVAAHRANASLIVQIIDQAGTVLLTDAWAYDTSVSLNNGGKNLANWARGNVFVTAPAGGVRAKLYLRAAGVGEVNPFAWFVRPQFTEVSAQLTAAPSYAPGNGGTDTKYASVTQSLQTQVTTAQSGVTTMFARYTLALDVNGYVSGIRSENTGSTSTFDILADKFRILAPGGGERTEYSGGNWRVYDASNMLRVRWGVW